MMTSTATQQVLAMTSDSDSLLAADTATSTIPATTGTTTSTCRPSVTYELPDHHPHNSALRVASSGSAPSYPPSILVSTTSSQPPSSPLAHTIPAIQDPETRKSRTPRDVAKKLFEQAISSSTGRNARRTRKRSVSNPTPFAMTAPPGMIRVVGGGNSGIPSHHFAPPYTPTPQSPNSASMETASSASTASAETDATVSTTNRPSLSRGRPNAADSLPLSVPFAPVLVYEKPQATTSGGALSMTIQLTEPILFLQGLDSSESVRRPAMLRGSLMVRVTKPSKIKAISLTFRGRERTEWPEGIPPKKSEYFEEKEIMQHTWPFFNAQFITAELGHCADSFQPLKPTGPSESGTGIGNAISNLARSASPAQKFADIHSKGGTRISHSRSFSKGEAQSAKYLSVAQQGYRMFQPGDYVYNFEMPIDSCLPETIQVDYGSVKYELDGCIERPGAFRPNLSGKKEVELIRVPSESNLEQTEPIAISRTWEDQLHYDIVISGKAFPLGTSIPIAFKLTPLAKVRCHRIKIFITENVEYTCKNKKIHRLDPTKKVQLFEKRADAQAVSTFAGSSVRTISGGGISEADQGTNPEDVVNGCDNLLGDLNGSPNVGPTEMEFNVQLPGCSARDRDRVHFDTNYGNIQVHHWIKIVMRLSKQDPVDPNKRRHFEISIDSPFHILSCQATHANMTLPEYGAPQPGGPAAPGSCHCPTGHRHPHPRVTVPGPQRNPVQQRLPNDFIRPMHLIRQPSMNPPPFDADVPPPPIITPPPQYDTVVESANGLAGYFSRLAHYDAIDPSSDDSESEEPSIGNRRSHLPPLTPGGRLARSMDEQRTWEAIGQIL